MLTRRTTTVNSYLSLFSWRAESCESSGAKTTTSQKTRPEQEHKKMPGTTHHALAGAENPRSTFSSKTDPVFHVPTLHYITAGRSRQGRSSTPASRAAARASGCCSPRSAPGSTNKKRGERYLSHHDAQAGRPEGQREQQARGEVKRQQQFRRAEGRSREQSQPARQPAPS